MRTPTMCRMMTMMTRTRTTTMSRRRMMTRRTTWARMLTPRLGVGRVRLLSKQYEMTYDDELKEKSY